MSAIKSLDVNANLTVSLSGAITEAIKAGMSKDDVAAVLTKLAEMLEAAD